MSDWVRDGHGVRCHLDGDNLSLEWECPNQTPALPVAWDALPHCRRSWTEWGQPDRDDPAVAYCNVGEWITNNDDGMLNVLDTDVTHGMRLPLHPLLMVGYRWNGDCYLWAPSTAIDAFTMSTDNQAETATLRFTSTTMHPCECCGETYHHESDMTRTVIVGENHTRTLYACACCDEEWTCRGYLDDIAAEAEDHNNNCDGCFEYDHWPRVAAPLPPAGVG